MATSLSGFFGTGRFSQAPISTSSWALAGPTSTSYLYFKTREALLLGLLISNLLFILLRPLIGVLVQVSSRFYMRFV